MATRAIAQVPLARAMAIYHRRAVGRSRRNRPREMLANVRASAEVGATFGRPPTDPERNPRSNHQPTKKMTLAAVTTTLIVAVDRRNAAQPRSRPTADRRTDPKLFEPEFM